MLITEPSVMPHFFLETSRRMYYIHFKEIHMSTAISVRLPEKLANALEQISKETERPKSFHIQKALEMYFEERADLHIALDRLNDPTDPDNCLKRIAKFIKKQPNTGWRAMSAQFKKYAKPNQARTNPAGVYLQQAKQKYVTLHFR